MSMCSLCLPRFIWNCNYQPTRCYFPEIDKHTVHICLSKVFEDMQRNDIIIMFRCTKILTQKISLLKLDLWEVSFLCNGSDSFKRIENINRDNLFDRWNILGNQERQKAKRATRIKDGITNQQLQYALIDSGEVI